MNKWLDITKIVDHLAKHFPFAPPTCVAELENRMNEMIRNVKFKDVKCRFQKKIASDIQNIKKTDSLFVPADKTTNFYKMDPAILQPASREKYHENL